MSQRRAPERTCVACRRVRPKRELIRVVRSPDGHVRIDPSGKAPGRGAYIGPARECLRRAFERQALERSLRVRLSAEDRAALEAEMYKRRATCPFSGDETPPEEVASDP